MQLEHTQQKEEVIDGKTLVEKTSVNPTFFLFFFFMCSVNLFYTVTLVVIVFFFFFFTWMLATRQDFHCGHNKVSN